MKSKEKKNTSAANKVSFNRISDDFNVSVKFELNKDLFKGMTFCVDIQLDGESKDEMFKNTITELGGKLSKVMNKYVTHLLWSSGRLRTLSRAVELDDVKIVTPLWLKDCVEAMKLFDEVGYQPSNLEENIRAANDEQIKEITG